MAFFIATPFDPDLPSAGTVDESIKSGSRDVKETRREDLSAGQDWALERLTFLEDEGKVGYRHGEKGAELETMDYLEFIARVTSHIPDKGQVTVRYLGLYANAHRWKVRKAISAAANRRGGCPPCENKWLELVFVAETPPAQVFSEVALMAAENLAGRLPSRLPVFLTLFRGGEYHDSMRGG